MSSGCYGRVEEWFISRQLMPKICGDNLCIRMDECFRASFEKLTGVKPGPGFSYKFETPKWRARES